MQSTTLLTATTLAAVTAVAGPQGKPQPKKQQQWDYARLRQSMVTMPVDRRQGGNGQRGNYHTVGVVWNSVSKVHIYFGSRMFVFIHKTKHHCAGTRESRQAHLELPLSPKCDYRQQCISCPGGDRDERQQRTRAPKHTLQTNSTKQMHCDGCDGRFGFAIESMNIKAIDSPQLPQLAPTASLLRRQTHGKCKKG